MSSIKTKLNQRTKVVGSILLRGKCFYFRLGRSGINEFIYCRIGWLVVVRDLYHFGSRISVYSSLFDLRAWDSDLGGSTMDREWRRRDPDRGRDGWRDRGAN